MNYKEALKILGFSYTHFRRLMLAGLIRREKSPVTNRYVYNVEDIMREASKRDRDLSRKVCLVNPVNVSLADGSLYTISENDPKALSAHKVIEKIIKDELSEVAYFDEHDLAPFTKGQFADFCMLHECALTHLTK